MTATAALRTVKLIHTAAWAFFATCVLLLPVMAWRHEHLMSGILVGTISIEVAILAVNGWRCPLTAVAARYTDDRRDNFDIYLPLRLARYNKHIFGSLFVVGILILLLRH